jgi:hypothetical protein
VWAQADSNCVQQPVDAIVSISWLLQMLRPRVFLLGCIAMLCWIAARQSRNREGAQRATEDKFVILSNDVQHNLGSCGIEIPQGLDLESRGRLSAGVWSNNLSHVNGKVVGLCLCEPWLSPNMLDPTVCYCPDSPPRLTRRRRRRLHPIWDADDNGEYYDASTASTSAC